MPTRQFHQLRRVFSASNVRWAIAEALNEIKEADDLTDEDMGAILGKSPDRARAYRRQEATMDAETFGRAKREWNGRFSGYFDRLCEDSRPGKVSDPCTLTALLDLAARLAKALEDGRLDPNEIKANRAQLENVRDMIDAQLGKLGAES
jgi:hypothetical protein